MNRALVALLLAVPALSAPSAGAADKPPSTADLYKLHCQQCHMADGDSPLPPLNFVDGTWKHGTAPAKVAAVIADGVPGTAMLPYGTKLTPAEVKALAAHVRNFDKALRPPKPPKKK